MSEPSPVRVYRPEIDGLRAIAVLAVVLFHAEVPYFTGGFVGVDIFFVISGYLISRNIIDDIEAGRFMIGSFYVSRFKRLIPAFLFALLFTFVLGIFILSPIHFSELGKTTINATLSLSNIFFWQDADYFATDSRYIPLLHMWSLSVEEQFYAIWPVFLVLCLSFVSRKGLLWILGLIFAASLLAAIWVAYVDTAAGFYLMPFRMFEFCMGAMCIWFGKLRRHDSPEAESAVALAYVLLAWSIFGFTDKTPFPSFYALIPCLSTVLLIVYGNTRLGGALLRNKLAVWIGLISYSLYLFHWPLLVYGQYVKFGELTAVEKIAIILLAVLVSVFSFWFVERPYRKLSLFSWPIAPQRFIVGSLCVALLTVFLGAHAWGGKGWKFRIEKDGRRVISLTSIDVYSPCRQPSRELKQSGFRCAFGKSSGPDGKVDVILLGDSHAEHWLPGLDQLLKENRLTAVYAGDGGALPFSVGMSMTADGPTSFSYEKPFDYIKENKPPIVILGARWAASTHASRPDGAALWYGLENLWDRSATASQKAIKTAASETMKLLENAGSQVVLLGQIPLVGFDLVACLSRPKIVGFLNQNSDCHGYTAKQVIARDQTMRPFFTELASDHQNAMYVDFIDPLCQSEYCKKKLGETVLYRDDDHLSFQGSVALANAVLAPKFDVFAKKASRGN